METRDSQHSHGDDVSGTAQEIKRSLTAETERENEARDLQFAARCRSLASLGMTIHESWEARELRIRPATFLVFLAASARARIVASNFCARAHHLLNLHVASTSHARLFQLLLFLALECLFDIVHGCGNLTRRASIATTTAGDDCRYAGLGSLARRPLGSATRPRSLVRWPLHDLHQVQVADRFFLKALHHLFEHVVGLALVDRKST